MSIIGNIIWLIFGGLMVAVEYFIAAFALCCTIIGIPFGLQVVKIGILALFPFGSHSVVVDPPRGCLSMLMNLIWILIGGFWIAITHFVWGAILCITIIGIPFGRQHFKLMSLAFTPFGRNVVTDLT